MKNSWVIALAWIALAVPLAALLILACLKEDIQFVPEYRRVDVTVHNVGSAAARNVIVVLSDGAKEVRRQRIPNIEAPLGLDARSVPIGFLVTPGRDRYD